MFRNLAAIALVWALVAFSFVAKSYADRTNLTAITSTGSYPTAGASATSLTAADTVNLNSLTMTGVDLLVVQNSGAGEHNVTISSVADPITGRTGTFTEAIAAGEFLIYGPFEKLDGWSNGGKLHFEADHAEVLFLHFKTR